MADGYTALQGMIARLRKLGDSAEDMADDIAHELRDELDANIAASRGPDGTAWKPTREGTAPLQNAGAALGVAAVGTKVLAAVRGVEARHHYGTVKGKVARPILPTSKLPPRIVELITKVVQRRFKLIMGGA
jgi:hypothetical protein